MSSSVTIMLDDRIPSHDALRGSSTHDECRGLRKVTVPCDRVGTLHQQQVVTRPAEMAICAEARALGAKPGTYVSRYEGTWQQVSSAKIMETPCVEACVIEDAHHPAKRGHPSMACFGCFATADIPQGAILTGANDYLRGGLVLHPMHEEVGDEEFMHYDIEICLPKTGVKLVARGNPLSSSAACVNDPNNNLAPKCELWTTGGRPVRCTQCNVYDCVQNNAIYVVLLRIENEFESWVGVGIETRAHIPAGNEVLVNYGKAYQTYIEKQFKKPKTENATTAMPARLRKATRLRKAMPAQLGTKQTLLSLVPCIERMGFTHEDLELLPKDLDLDALYASFNDVSSLGWVEGREMNTLLLDHQRCCLSDISSLKLANINNLDLSGNRISDLSALAGKSFDSLNLSDNPIACIDPLSSAAIHALDISDTLVTSISALKGCRSLSQLGLGGLRLSLEHIVSCLVEVKSFTDVRIPCRLSLWRTETGTDDMTPLGRLTALDSVWVSKGADVSRVGIDDLAVFVGDPEYEILSVWWTCRCIASKEAIDLSLRT
jgi:hypothetical protein